jgi:hypothetical protein
MRSLEKKDAGERVKEKLDWMDVQEPDNLGAGFAAAQRDDVSAEES